MGKANKAKVIRARAIASGVLPTIKPGSMLGTLTNLDIIGIVLSQATGKPSGHWRNVVTAALAVNNVDLADTKLLEVVPADEAHILLTRLGREQKGVLRWIVEGMRLSYQATPSELNRFRMYMNNMQN